MSFVLLVCLLFPDEITIYGGTNLYGYSPDSTDVAVSPSGNLYFLAYKEGLIRRYDSSGVISKEFGGKGKGPGEFISPIQIGFVGGKVWVFDYMESHISFFDEDGNFLFRRYSASMGRVFKTANGWYFTQTYDLEHTPSFVYALDEDLENRQLVKSWIPKWEKKKVRGKRNKVNPIIERIKFDISEDGRFFFISHVGSSYKMSVIDTTTHKVIRTIQPGWSPRPFDRDWGERRIAVHNEAVKGYEKLSLDAPENFPFVRAFRTLPDQKLLFLRWSGIESEKNYFFMDQMGKPAPFHCKGPSAFRVLAFRGDDVYLSAFDLETEQGIVVRCKKNALDKVAAEFGMHPRSKIIPQQL